MTPAIPQNPTRTLAEEQDEYLTLHIRDETTEDGNVMLSEWTPTQEELDQLNAGGRVVLGILGTVHPPVMLVTTGGEG